VQVPGAYTIVEHSLSRLVKGAAGQLVVHGDAALSIFASVGQDASSATPH